MMPRKDINNHIPAESIAFLDIFDSGAVSYCFSLYEEPSKAFSSLEGAYNPSLKLGFSLNL